jgi:TolB-like protein
MQQLDPFASALADPCRIEGELGAGDRASARLAQDVRYDPRAARIAIALLLWSVVATPLLAQCPDGTPPPCRAAGGARTAPTQLAAALSIAVLPFQSRSPDSADAYLADGMTEEVTNQLTRVGRLQVKARGLVAAQWRRTPDPFEAARRLNVAWFVHGNVRRVSGQLLVNVELVRATTGEEAWASRFPRRDTDVFAVQAEVAESVAVQVGGRLTPGERAVIARRPTGNNEAYRLYLYGNTLMGRRTAADLREAVAAFERAVQLDPRFAAAWARIGVARGIQSSWGWEPQIGVDSLLAIGRRAAQRAVTLDSTSAESWFAAAYADQSDGILWRAQRSFERALRRDSLQPEIFHGYGVIYAVDCPGYCLHDERAGLPLLRRAVALDPTLRNTWRHMALLVSDAGRFAEAEALLDTALSYGPWTPGYQARAVVRTLRGNAAGALADLDAQLAIDGDSNTYSRAQAALVLGDSAPARAELARLRAVADTSRFSAFAVAGLAAQLGMREVALATLERLFSRPAAFAPECAPGVPCSAALDVWVQLHNPVYAPLRQEPRFRRLLEETRPRVPWLAGRDP